MSVRQATQAIRLVSQALRQPIDPVAFAALERQSPSGTLAERLAQLGERVDIAFFTRGAEAAAVRTAAASGSLPLLLVPVGGNGDGRLVLLRTEDRTVVAEEITADGAVVRLTGDTPEALADAALARVGAPAVTLTPLALQPGVAPRLPGTGGDASGFDDHSRDDVGAPGYDPLKVAAESRAVSRVWELLRKEKRDVIVVFFYAALAGLFSLTLPLSIGGIVQLIQGGLIIESATVLIVYVIVATILTGVLQVLQLSAVERIQQRVFARMAFEFTFRLPRVRYETALREDLPETMNRLFEAPMIQKSLSKFLLDVSTALLTIVFGLILLAFYHPYFIAFGFVLVVALVLTFWFTGPKGLGTSLLESKYKYRAVHWLEEVARAFHAFKFGGRSRLALERMDGILTQYLKYRRKHFGVLVQQTIAMVVFKSFITAGLLILGTVLVVNRQITLGQFVASEIVVVTVLSGVEKLVLSLSVVYDVLTSAEKAGHVTDLPVDVPGPVTLPVRAEGIAIEARDVSFRYREGGRPALTGIDLQIAAGERVAITGYKGAGRSTLLRILGGLLDNYDGSISFDERALREIDQEALRERVGQVLSLTDLFEGTFADNIAVGRAHLDDDAVRRAVRDISLERDVQDLPEGLRTPIINGGRHLPSHIAVKLLLAQGIVGDPRLVLFDDLFMNLLPDDRRRVLQLLTDRARPWTVIAVTHDPVMLAAFDRVLVVEDGRIVAQGPFRELCEANAYCRELMAQATAPTLAPAGGNA